jgi:hypothetical protein
LHEKDSELAHLLLSEKFKFENQEAKISVRKLIIFSYLHCRGPTKDKIVSFYNILKDGGVEAHP